MEKTGVYVSNKHGDSMIHSLSLGFSMAIFFFKKRKNFRGKSHNSENDLKYKSLETWSFSNTFFLESL